MTQHNIVIIIVKKCLRTTWNQLVVDVSIYIQEKISMTKKNIEAQSM